MIRAGVETFLEVPRFIVAVTPQRYDAQRIVADRCLPLVSACAVAYRDWTWPYADGINSWGPREAYVAGETDFSGFSYHLEQWRLYRSGQFVCRTMFAEAANERYQEETRSAIKRRHPERSYSKEPLKFISFLSVIYFVTAAYQFAFRLANEAQFETFVDIYLQLRGIKEWVIGPSEPSRLLNDVYMARIDNPESFARLQLDALGANPNIAAIPAITSLFRQLGWMNPPAPNIIGQHQAGMWR